MGLTAADTEANSLESRERILIDSAWRESRALRDHEDAPVDADLIPGYRLGHCLGRGAQGAVYAAQRVGEDRTLALKLVHASRSARHRARLLAEIAAQRRLDHPNILPIVDAGETEHGAWFVTPYVEGGVLDPAHVLSRMTLQEAIAMVAKVAGAVHEAHLHGVLHRDLKPSNILVRQDDEPFVVDFGLARLESPSASLPALTMSGEFVGSLAWASPEQLEGDGRRVDVRSDVYALGVILHQIVTRGGTPFGPADDVRGLMRRILHESPTSPRREAPDLPHDIETIIQTCLQREPHRRYQSSGELERDLKRWLRGEPIEARRRTAFERVWLWMRRHRAVAALLSLLGVVMLAGVIGISIATVRATRAEAEATRARLRAEALNAFLLDEILAAPRPDQQGRDVLLVEALRTAGARLDSSFPNDPGARAEVARTIGVSFMALGLYDEAESFLQTSLQLADRAGDDAGDAAFAASNQLAKLQWLQGRPDEAATLFERTLDGSMRRFGERHDRTLEAMTGLAVMRRLQGDLSEARALCERAIAIRERVDGPLHEETITLLNNLAILERQAGDFDRAIELLNDVRERAATSLGVGHPSTILAAVNLGSTLLASNQRTEAAAILRDALADQIETLGPNHPELGSTQIALATALIGADDDRAAELLDDAESVLPPGAIAERARIADLRARLAPNRPTDR